MVGLRWLQVGHDGIEHERRVVAQLAIVNGPGRRRDRARETFPVLQDRIFVVGDKQGETQDEGSVQNETRPTRAGRSARGRDERKDLRNGEPKCSGRSAESGVTR